MHEGVQLEFAHRSGSDAAAGAEGGGGGGGAWRAGLDVLSGGQRMLVSLTFLFAVCL